MREAWLNQDEQMPKLRKQQTKKRTSSFVLTMSYQQGLCEHWYNMNRFVHCFNLDWNPQVIPVTVVIPTMFHLTED